MEGELVVHRIVGTVRPMQNANAAAAQALGMGFAKVQFGTALVVGGAMDPLNANELGVEDWLWFWNYDFAPGAFNNSAFDLRVVDIKVKRRLETNETVAFFVSNPGAVGVTVSIDVRILITVRI